MAILPDSFLFSIILIRLKIKVIVFWMYSKRLFILVLLNSKQHSRKKPSLKCNITCLTWILQTFKSSLFGLDWWPWSHKHWGIGKIGSLHRYLNCQTQPSENHLLSDTYVCNTLKFITESWKDFPQRKKQIQFILKLSCIPKDGNLACNATESCNFI